MKLSFEQIKSITTGVVRMTQEEDGIHFFRFTEEQMSLTQPRVRFIDRKVLASAGVRLSFRTDSRTFFLRAAVGEGSARSYFSFELMVNGVHTDSLDNFSHLDLPENVDDYSCDLGTYEKLFELGTGEKDVCVYFPWSVAPVVEELSLDDGASLIPLIPSKKLLAYGDSITHGYDSARPSNHYVSRLARALDAQEFNKGIGGATSFPELARIKDPIDPDYVLVAYGSNDWNRYDEAFFTQQYRAMHQAIQDNYPRAQVFAITPVWRGDFQKPRKMGSLAAMEGRIRSIAADFPNVTVISGYDLVPHDQSYFADLRLHPNDAGFDHYFNNLWPKIKAALKE